MSEVDFSETAAQILRDLKLSALRARFRALEPWMTEIRSSSGKFFFYLDPYEFASSDHERKALRAKVRALNEHLTARRLELAADGIWPEVMAYAEPGNEHLTVFVEFSEKGRKTLQSSRVALSGLLGSTRRFLWLGLTTVAIVLVAATMVDRINKQGWVATTISLSVVVMVVVASLWAVRKKRVGV
jgi:hypothetical protein